MCAPLLRLNSSAWGCAIEERSIIYAPLLRLSSSEQDCMKKQLDICLIKNITQYKHSVNAQTEHACTAIKYYIRFQLRYFYLKASQ